jgi:hypothetical protein
MNTVYYRQHWVYVSNGVSEHITEELAPSFLDLGLFFSRTSFRAELFNVERLPLRGTMYLEDHTLQAREVGQGDTSNATVLYT